MLSTKIKKVNAYQFSHEAGMEALFHNLRLLGSETGAPVADALAATENDFAAIRNSPVLIARVWLADPADRQLRDFCEKFFEVEPGNGDWPVSKTWSCADFRLHAEITTSELRCGQAFSPQPSVQVFLLRQQAEHLEVVAECLSDGRPLPAMIVLLSPDDLLHDDGVAALMQQNSGRLRCFSCTEWSRFDGPTDAFRSLIGSGASPGLLAVHGYIRPVRNFSKHFHALLTDRRTRVELQYKSMSFEMEMSRNGSKTKNLRQEAGARVNKMVREQSVFMDQQLDQAAQNTSPLPDDQIPFRSESVGKKMVWQVHPEFLRDRHREMAAKEEQMARQVQDLHHRFMESLQQALPGTSGQNAPVHLNDLTGNNQSLALPQAEDYHFEQPKGLLVKVLSGALRPVMTTSMVFSVASTILGLFSDGLQGISLRTIPTTLRVFFNTSVIPQLLGVGLILAILYILVNNYLSGKKELAHQYANEHRKVFLRLQSDLGRWKDESVKRLKTNYKTLLERCAQSALAEHEHILEKQNERDAHQEREWLRTLERQIAAAQDDLKSIIEAERALALHEESLLEYENLLWQKIKTTVQS